MANEAVNAAAAKVKVISTFIAKMIILPALNLVEKRFIDRIPADDVKNGLKIFLTPVRNMVEALSDEEPRNAEQVREIWRKFVNLDLTDFSQSVVLRLIGKIKNEEVRRPLATVASPVVDMVRVSTDTDPRNEEQIKALWLAFIQDPNTHVVVLEDLLEPALRATIKDAETIQFILQIVAEALRAGTELQKAAAARMVTRYLQAAA